MTTLSGYLDTIDHGLGLVKEALAHLPGDLPTVALLRVLVQQVEDHIAISDMRVALAEVEAEYSAKAQAGADAWQSEPTKPE